MSFNSQTLPSLQKLDQVWSLEVAGFFFKLALLKYISRIIATQYGMIIIYTVESKLSDFASNCLPRQP